ncbi:MAG: hypothetical protein ABIH85_02025 [Candidatus Omnitrophota bacterium]
MKIGHVPDFMTIDELKDLMDGGYKQFYYRAFYYLKKFNEHKVF